MYLYFFGAHSLPTLGETTWDPFLEPHGTRMPYRIVVLACRIVSSTITGLPTVRDPFGSHHGSGTSASGSKAKPGPGTRGGGTKAWFTGSRVGRTQVASLTQRSLPLRAIEWLDWTSLRSSERGELRDRGSAYFR